MASTSTSNYNDIDEVEASGSILSIFRENRVYLGGSSVGKGFITAAQYYLTKYLANEVKHLPFLNKPGADLLNPNIAVNIPVEDSFYVVDIGVLISQYYQWRKYFPRVEVFYAVKCNPDPLIIKTLLALGANFDCASREEIRLVQGFATELAREPEIIYANPCKARLHLIEAVCRGVTLVTVDNVNEIIKCASVSKDIRLVMRIATDDRGSQCRLSSKYGATPERWRPLLSTAKKCGLEFVGVSFHVGSGCRDATRYELALCDSRKIFDMAENEYGFNMTILDIGGGFPGETHSIWNPQQELDPDDDDDKIDEHFMYFTEIATTIAPVIDEMFPEESGVRVIAEPGRYFVAAAATLVASVVALRNNLSDGCSPVDDVQAAKTVDKMTRGDENYVISQRARSFSEDGGEVLGSIANELADYSKLFARQHLSQQEADVYNDNLDMYKEGYYTAVDLLGPPDKKQMKNSVHTVEGMDINLVNRCGNDEDVDSVPAGMLSFAAAGEAAINGVVLQSVVDVGTVSDSFAYYLNDGVYSAFNNIMYDHAIVRPRHLRSTLLQQTGDVTIKTRTDGMILLEKLSDSIDMKNKNDHKYNKLYASTVFGPTCDSIDVIARSVLLPQLEIGDWLYFQNMGAYTMAASSCFNGFSPSQKFYVCSVPVQYLEKIIAGCAPDNIFEDKCQFEFDEEEKKQ